MNRCLLPNEEAGYKLFFFLLVINSFIYKVVNDEDHENNGESKEDTEEEAEDSEEDVYGVTTVINLKKHQVGN